MIGTMSGTAWFGRLLAASLGLVALSSAAAGCSSGHVGDEDLAPDAAEAVATAGVEAPGASTDALRLPAVEYFAAVRDVRRCASPLCGGFFVRAVNRLLTRCADGSIAERCYVAEIDWTAAGGEPTDSGRERVVRGSIESNVFPSFGDLGRFVAVEAWGSPTDALGTGAFFRLADNGIRCITDPCFSTDAQLLNAGVTLALSDIDLTNVGASPEELERAAAAIAEGDLIVAGRVRLRQGTAGIGLELRASQFYLPSAEGCTSDADCAEGNWCRVTETGGYACVPFVREGERCDGFTVPWMYEQCSPELVCDPPEFVIDAPGVCRSRCRSDADCDADAYCATDGLCHADGSCDISIDCVQPGNNYPHILCVGHPVCPLFGEGEGCGWVCRDPRCLDLYGADFGPCDAVLGWAVVSGRCTQVSGCDARGFELFASERECAAACISP